jgi:hypothetical protein
MKLVAKPCDDGTGATSIAIGTPAELVEDVEENSVIGHVADGTSIDELRIASVLSRQSKA